LSRPWADDLCDRLWAHKASRSRRVLPERPCARPTRALSTQQLRRLRVG
jgi:hypothetical protein